MKLLFLEGTLFYTIDCLRQVMLSTTFFLNALNPLFYLEKIFQMTIACLRHILNS